MDAEPKNKTYRLKKAYRSDCFGVPLLLPAGTLCKWWAERGFFLFDAVEGHCAWIDRWPVEAWRDYFEPVQHGH